MPYASKALFQLCTGIEHNTILTKKQAVQMCENLSIYAWMWKTDRQTDKVDAGYAL